MRAPTNFQPLLRTLFVLAIAATTLLALLPPSSVPSQFQFWDKLQHGIAYASLALLGGIAFPRRLMLLAAGLVCHGAAIELMQGALATSRQADPVDWFADCLGILVALLVLAGWRQRIAAAGESTAR